MINYYDIYQNTKDFRVLYVEDDLRSRQELNEVFQDLFYRVDLASDGEEGLTKYRNYFEKTNSYYDIVFTDLIMPQMDGIELSKAILQINPKQNLVVVSAHDKPQYLIELINMDVHKFLLKPFNPEKILALIDSISSPSSNTNYSESAITKIDDNYSWVEESLELKYNQTPLHLTKIETTLMRLLIKNGSRVSTSKEILATLWEDKNISKNKNLATLISRLRKKLPKDIIKTLYGIGYRLSRD